ncbi:BEN domain-containing protein 6-like [Nasonia vitripennis]|uniref:BEN domain-containing protein n=1 Tax=Nasonia vitripennis TaxID=7425 RepID=A0A7M7IWB6_NASVI|nr:BEN domain-containing protein 6-like [Nasonia vitripennis]
MKQSKSNDTETGGFSLSSTVLKNLNKSDPKSYINDLLENVFTSEKLAESSVTGKPGNARKNSDAKPALDGNRMAYIKKLVQNRFGYTKQNRTLINKMTYNKISYKRKELKK